jgi:hypothetical protein
MKKQSDSRNRSFPIPVYLYAALLLGLALALFPLANLAKDPIVTAGLVREFSASTEYVRQAVRDVLHDRIVHGTLVFDKEPILTGAEVVDSTPLFAPWEGPGDVFYKIRKEVVAPRHFLQSADMGTIAVRYVVIPSEGGRTRVRIDAVYVESAHRVIHVSDGNVEKMEMKEIKDHIEAAEEAAQQAAEAKRRKDSAAIVHQTFIRQREDETTRLNSAESLEKQLQQQIDALRHEVERRVKAPGAELKAAPFLSAATLKSIPASSDLVILIVTPHWLGVETQEGQRGWIQEANLEPLPQ